MPFNPLETGLWDREPKKIEDFACTLVSPEPRICVLTFKVDGKFIDYMIGPDQAAEISELLAYTTNRQR